jgi:ribosome maturation factor RimP
VLYFGQIERYEKRGRPRFVVVGARIITSSLSEAFEQAVQALAREPEFKNVEILAARAQKSGRNIALSVVADAAGGVDLSICERIAARINAALDLRPEKYTLEVQSPGAWPLKERSDYERFRGRRVRVRTGVAVVGSDTHIGTLAGLHEDAVVLDTGKGELQLPLDAVKSVHLDIDIRADLQRAKRERRRS